MRRATERLAARAGIRQVEVVLRAGRAARAASAGVARVWRAVQAAIRAGDLPAAREALRLLRVGGAAALARELSLTAYWAHRSARYAISREIPRRRLRRLVSPLSLGESLSLDDLLAPLRDPADTDTDILDLLFPPPSVSRVEDIVYSTGWIDRIRSGTRYGSPEALASVIASGLTLGRNHREIAAELLPYVEGVRSSAARVARTESMRVAAAAQMDAHSGLGDLVVGYQIHATLDERTRPEHRARDGTIYWRDPKPGQLGYESMPRPPMEADGTVAWNCRCYLVPVFSEPGGEPLEPAPVPDQLVYADWFLSAGERRRRLAVGSRRYDAVRQASGEDAPGWEHFFDVDSGKLLPVEAIKSETGRERRARLARVRAAIAARRADKGRVLGTGSA